MDEKRFDDEIQEYIARDRTLRVLVVDDSTTIRRAIAERLKIGGLDIDEACDGKEALTKIYKKAPDVVLLDVVMPRMDGLTVLKILRKNYSKLQLPIILVTSRNTTTELIEALDMGANDYVTKPVDFDLLWARLTNQLMQKLAAEYLTNARKELEIEVKKRTQELNDSHESLKREMQAKIAAEEELKRQASYDALTGLPNRNLARDRMTQMLAKAKRQGLKPSIVFIDLDNFKYVNDTLGHAAGDELLKEAASRLSKCTRESDTVARLGGDEFLLIIDEIDNSSKNPRELDLKIIGERIIEEYAKPFFLEGQEVNVSPSIGFAIYPKDGDDSETLMKNADAAMYRSKNEGKNTFCFYSPDMTDKAKQRIEMESKLRHALKKNELKLVYQPIVESNSGNIVKAEVLLRWQNEEAGMIRPDIFIPIAEETGIILEIGEWVIQTACQQLRKWKDAGFESLCLTINVSARQFQADSNLCEAVISAIKTNGLAADEIQLELTEGVLIEENEHTINVMKALENFGIKLLIDDFGTGYASLSYLQKYNFDTIKIDRSYVCKLNENEQDEVLVKAIVAMANTLGVNVVSEGVETQEQLEKLIEFKCKYAQGYYFSAPVDAETFGKIYEDNNHNWQEACQPRRKIARG